mmetsp:Transcript_4151/g.10773  ORF Transcript_4151/g.10773 Transcript_4151/m.10773 type:complete len:225 (+) Transcript_4151:739-1413(+)
MDPPIVSCTSSLHMESPNPVPPKFRATDKFACWYFSKIVFWFSLLIPIPVSVTTILSERPLALCLHAFAVENAFGARDLGSSTVFFLTATFPSSFLSDGDDVDNDDRRRAFLPSSFFSDVDVVDDMDDRRVILRFSSFFSDNDDDDDVESRRAAFVDPWLLLSSAIEVVVSEAMFFFVKEDTRTCIPPFSVNFTAFDKRFNRTCRNRFGSPNIRNGMSLLLISG